MGVILEYDWRDTPLFAQAKPHIRDVRTVLDIGAGIRPQALVSCQEHFCVEPHGEYADRLAAAGFKVIRDSAPHVFDFCDMPVDTVVLLDVIEHMEKDDGADTIRRARAMAREQLIVFTPLGFMPQTGGEESDAWGMQGQQWQKHRSGWTPGEFPGWLHLIDEHFGDGHPAFFAIWNAE